MGVFGDHRGIVIGAYCFDVQSIEYAYQHGWRMLWIELDSMAVFRCLQSSFYRPPWPIAMRWDNCKQLLSGMLFYCFHIYKKGNTLADRTAYMGLDHEIPFW